MRILIAEDDPKLLKNLTHIFVINNYAVDGVDNSSDAFDLAASGEYDGLVLDARVGDVVKFNILREGKSESVSFTVTEDRIIEY